MDAEEFSRLAHTLVDAVAGYLDSLPDRRVTRGESPDAVRAALNADLPLQQAGTDASALQRSTTGEVPSG